MTSLKGVPLDPYFLAQIHVQPLVPEAARDIRAETTDFRSLGENRKNILVLVSDATAAFLPDESFSFLVSVLVACKLTMVDIALVNLFHYPGTDFRELSPQFSPQACIQLGVTLFSPGKIPGGAYLIHETEGVKILTADTLERISADQSLKAKFWSSLKQLFNLS